MEKIKNVVNTIKSAMEHWEGLEVSAYAIPCHVTIILQLEDYIHSTKPTVGANGFTTYGDIDRMFESITLRHYFNQAESVEITEFFALCNTVPEDNMGSVDFLFHTQEAVVFSKIIDLAVETPKLQGLIDYINACVFEGFGVFITLNYLED